MDVPSSNRELMQGRSRTLLLGLAIAAVVLASATAAVVAAQVEVTDSDVGVTRTCGSVFDSVTDRSGWETWWARDLDETDVAVRSALVRTTGCPDAINLRLAVGATLAGIAAILALVLLAVTNRQGRPPAAGSGEGDRLLRLGRATSYVGAALTMVGLLALVVLVADADSTLFLYTDRLVVGIVGLIVLVPTVALFVIGRALMILAGTGDRWGETRGDVVETEIVDA